MVTLALLRLNGILVVARCIDPMQSLDFLRQARGQRNRRVCFDVRVRHRQHCIDPIDETRGRKGPLLDADRCNEFWSSGSPRQR